jgi:hypothetical protein
MYCANMAKVRLGIENMAPKREEIAGHLNAAVKDDDASAFLQAM